MGSKHLIIEKKKCLSCLEVVKQLRYIHRIKMYSEYRFDYPKGKIFGASNGVASNGSNLYSPVDRPDDRVKHLFIAVVTLQTVNVSFFTGQPAKQKSIHSRQDQIRSMQHCSSQSISSSHPYKITQQQSLYILSNVLFDDGRCEVMECYT